jgi:FKBP-type peptidyl-prolyl cis-trans isomerase FkpA
MLPLLSIALISCSQSYLDKAAGQPGAIKTASGMIYRELKPGTGPSPTATDTVKVNYRGTLEDGTEFDSSYKRNEPISFPLNQVIPCWTEGVQKMKVGGKSQLVCPANIAYGEEGRPPVIPGGATLNFEIELLGIGPS